MMTETLLINFLFLLLPLLVYLLFFETKLNIRRHQFVIFLFSALSLILCMSYPIQLSVGFIFDLRYIPFFICALYIGYKLAFPLYLVLNLYRFYIGGDGIMLSLLFATLVLLIVPGFKRSFIQLAPRQRLLAAGMVSLSVNLVYLASLSTFYQPVSAEFGWIALNVLPIHVFGTMLVTGLIEKGCENIKTREIYLESERLKVVSALSASISHEIRNPLTVTNGFLQLLSQSKTLAADDKKFIDYSLLELNRAEGIVRDFLALSKPQAENMVDTNLKAEFEYVNNVMHPYAHIHKVMLQFDFTNTLQRRVDKTQVQQCLINLYKNGIEAMKEGGGTLSISVTEHKQNIIIKITDTGVGMTKEQQKRIGKPYYSTKTEGTGLGMVYVYSTINSLKGRIEVESEQSQGTTFTLTIPAQRASASSKL